MDTYEQFFAWCASQGLKNDRLIAAAFGMTPQTVRNWKQRLKSGDGVPPAYLVLACAGYESARGQSGEVVPAFPQMTADWFEAWREHHHLETLERTGGAFGLTRQAIHNWFKRESLPRWLPLACLGYEIKVASPVEKATA